MFVKRKFRDLESGLPAAYQRAITAPPNEDARAPLIALAIDLSRKRHSSVPFADLSRAEYRLALHAFGTETLPRWMNRVAQIPLRSSERNLLDTLHQLKTSRPEKAKLHFGAVRKELALRQANMTPPR